MTPRPIRTSGRSLRDRVVGWALVSYFVGQQASFLFSTARTSVPFIWLGGKRFFLDDLVILRLFFGKGMLIIHRRLRRICRIRTRCYRKSLELTIE